MIDAWEHAYLQYENDKAAFFDAFWNVVDWPSVAAQFEAFAPSTQRRLHRADVRLSGHSSVGRRYARPPMAEKSSRIELGVESDGQTATVSIAGDSIPTSSCSSSPS